jgi:hypothetical protein
MLEWQTTSIFRNPKFHLAGSNVFVPVAGTRLSTFATTSDIGQPKQGHRPRVLFSVQSPQWRRASGRCAVRCVGHWTEANIGARQEHRTCGTGRTTTVFWSILRFSFGRFCYKSSRKTVHFGTLSVGATAGPPVSLSRVLAYCLRRSL